MKKIKFFIFLLTGMFFVLPTTYGNPQADRYDNVSTIVVQGRGSFSTDPDQAAIEIGIMTTATTAHIAEQENAKIAQAVQGNLLSIGIPRDKINTTGYSFYPAYSREENKSNEIIGYNVSNTVSITIDDLNLIGNVIDSSIQKGANNINSINFTVKNAQPGKQKALQSAVNDAKEKAEVIANTLGKRIVNVLNVSEHNTFIEGRAMGRYNMKQVADNSATATPVQPGKVDITANVEITFEIK